MSKTKQPYQEQIDGVCSELGITEKQYTDKTTIPELEAIIDKLEAQLPEEDDSEQAGEQLIDKVNTEQKDEQVTDKVNTEHKDEQVTDVIVEANSDETEQLEVIANSTFVYEVDGQSHTVVKGTRKFVPENIAMDALSANVATLVATVK